jgi:O-antigen ligase
MFDKGAERWSRNIESRSGTWEWRTSWWREIWRHVHKRTTHTLFGPGYGYPVWELHPDGTDDFPLRTPHNVVIYALGYTGWVGVALFVLVQAGLFAALAAAWRATGQCFGICLWVMGVVRSLGDNFFESPHFAIAFFVLAGLSLALPTNRPRTPHVVGEAAA